MRKEVIAHKDPKSPISEIFRTLRTNIQFMNTSKRLKVLQITSTFPGEGKSWVASNLAVTFAQAGKKVILIDADMRKGRLYSIFDISPRPGLSNYLSGFDSSTGELLLEGTWAEDQLIKISRIFNGKEMTEFNTTQDNLDPVLRFPEYCGGYLYDEETNTCYRVGIGYTLDTNGIAMIKGVWEKGVEVNTTILTTGWYNTKESCLMADPNIESIVIAANKYEKESYLDLSKYKKVATIEIKDHNFSNTDHFDLSGMKELTSLKIGNNCFYIDDRINRMNRTFTIVDCSELRSIIIGARSFLYYSGGFELNQLPSLELIQIGNKEEDSYSFSYSNLILKGKSFGMGMMSRFTQIENGHIGKSCI